MNVLAGHGGALRGGVLDVAHVTGVLELGLLGSEALLHVIIVAVLDVAMLDPGQLVAVLLGEDLAVLDGLDGGVVVVLVHLAVHGRLDVLMLRAGDVLVGDGRVDGL